MGATSFRGFPRECVELFGRLEANNDREWFKAHRDDFERFVFGPAREYVLAMGERLRRVVPGIHAEPFVDKSIFRLHRDTRFSKDKRPFKTHLGIFLWEGDGKKLDCPGFYLHLERDALMIGGGIHIFSNELLPAYREAVDDDALGPRLTKILAEGKQHFKKGLEDEAYKRVPRGFTPDHPRAELLKKKGVTLGEMTAIPDVLHTDKALDHVFRRFEKLVPLHRWLVEMTGAVVR